MNKKPIIACPEILELHFLHGNHCAGRITDAMFAQYYVPLRKFIKVPGVISIGTKGIWLRAKCFKFTTRLFPVGNLYIRMMDPFGQSTHVMVNNHLQVHLYDN